jgi:hypothetical protein
MSTILKLVGTHSVESFEAGGVVIEHGGVALCSC